MQRQQESVVVFGVLVTDSNVNSCVLRSHLADT